MPSGSVDLAGKIIDGGGDPKVGLTISLYKAADWEAGSAATATDTSDSDGLWNFDTQDITETWIVVAVDGTKKTLIDARNKIQLTNIDIIDDISVDDIFEHTAGSGVTIDTVVLKDGGVSLKADDADLFFGAGEDAAMRWSDGDADNHSLALGLGDSNQAFHITDKAAIATDWNVAADTHPTVYIHSNTTPATDYLLLGAHDGTTAYVDVVGGTTLSLRIAGNVELSVTAAGLIVPAGSDFTFTGTTGTNDIVLANGLADALSVTDGSADVLVIDTSTAGNVMTFTAAFTVSGAVSVDDTTDSTSATTGSIHTDGGLGVAKDLYVGDDILIAATGVINFGAGDVTLTHSAAKLTWGGDGAVEIDFNNHEMTNVDIDSGNIGGVTLSGTISGTPTWASNQAITLSTAAQGSVTSLGTLTALTMGGDINLDGSNIDNGGVIFLKEQAEADADVAGSGQIWVDTATPNVLKFTDDAGTDFTIAHNATTTLSSLVTVGALASGSIASGFGAIVATTIDATTDFTIGTTVITDDTVTFGGAASISTTTGNLTLSAAAGADVLLGDDATLLFIDGGRPGFGFFAEAEADSQVYFNFPARTAPASTNFAKVHMRSAGGALTIPAGTTNESGTFVIDEPNITATGTVVTAFNLKLTSGPTEGGTNNYNLWMPNGSFGVSDGDGTAGEQLQSGGAGADVVWAAAGSRREWKNLLDYVVTPQDALDRILGTRVYPFTFKDGYGTHDYVTEYLGPMADEAPWAMHHKGGVFNPISAFGHTVLAFQALEERLKELEAQVIALGGTLED